MFPRPVELSKEDISVIRSLASLPEFTILYKLIDSMITELNSIFIWQEEMNEDRYKGAIRVLNELKETIRDISTQTVDNNPKRG